MPAEPNSGVLVLPRIIPPAERTRSTKAESWSGMVSLNTKEPMVLRIPLVNSKSLMAMGRPSRAPVSPRPIFSSASLAEAPRLIAADCEEGVQLPVQSFNTA